MISLQERHKIRKVSTRILAIWWNLLNTWGWPKALEPEEPRNDPERRRRSALMDEIARTVGEREIIKRHAGHWK